MSAVEDKKALLYRYVEEVWDQHNLEAIDDFLSPDYQRHPSPTAEPLTRAGQKQLLSRFRAAFPDARLTIEEKWLIRPLSQAKASFKTADRRR